MRTYIWKGVVYTITEDEFKALLEGWIRPEEIFG